MITLTFLLIAYCIRNKYLSENARWYDKVFYYAVSVMLTPLVGPWLYKMLYTSKACTENEHRSVGIPIV